MEESIFQGRRVASVQDLERPGDYTGPHQVEGSDARDKVVWFLLPVPEGTFWRGHPGRGIQGIFSRWHKFYERKDGSLSAKPVITCGEEPYYWIGFLEKGHIWRRIHP